MMGGDELPRAVPAPEGYVSGAEFKLLRLQYWAVKKALNLMLRKKRGMNEDSEVVEN